uniref:STAS domain-containing protein n=1 Tax=Globisporangium ultimum (strain ATCC 200006 / CBS 805.95 / DAOM BR144) TaxID=431595 RepID=K3X516_GLOUD
MASQQRAPRDDTADGLSCHSMLTFVADQLRYTRQNCTRSRVLFFLKQHIPILEWLPSYDLREDLQYDIVAGVTVGMMIVPQEISLSTMMGVPPIYGLYTAALVPMIYPLFGTSRVLSVANGAEVSLLVGSAIKKIESVEERVATGILLTFLSGLLLLMMGVLRLGILADFFSRPVMGGFISAGGVLIMLSQCANWFGVKVRSRDLPFLTVLDLIGQSTHLNGTSFAVGALSILILLGMRMLKRSVVREMARLEEELEEQFEIESARAASQMSTRNAFMDDDEESNSSGNDDEDEVSGYEDIELGEVASITADVSQQKEQKKKKKLPSQESIDEATNAGSRTPRLPRLASSSASSSKWTNLPSVFSTGTLRRSDYLTSPWAPGARRMDSSNDLFDLEARSTRQGDVSYITRSTRHFQSANSMMDENVGFSLSDEDYLSREQQPRRNAATEDAANRRVTATMPPSLVRSSSESSVFSKTTTPTAGRPTPRRRKNSAQGQDEMIETVSRSHVEASTRTEQASAGFPPRVKNMVSPAKSIASDTDSACSTTALTGGGSIDPASSMSIRILRSKIAVLVALRLVCELGAFMVCLIGGIVGYLSKEGALTLTGEVPGGYPSPIVPWYGLLNSVIETDRLYHIIIDTLSIAIISYMSSIAMAKRLAIKEGYRIRPNQELIALGFSNLIGSFFQAMPSTGGLSRTAVNMQNARTQLASLITVGVVVIALYTATSVLAYLPKASLAAIIIVSGQSLIETKEAKWLYRVKRDEFYVWLASFILTVTLGVLPGLLSSIFCSLVAVIYKTRRPTLTMLGEIVDETTGATRLVDLDLYPETAHPLSDIVVIRVEGALYFANCEYIERVIEREISKRQQTEGVYVHGVIIDACSIMDWDSTTIQMMKHLQEDLLVRNIQLAIVNARDRLHTLLESSDYLYGIVRNDSRIGFDDAITAIREAAIVPDAVAGNQVALNSNGHAQTL